MITKLPINRDDYVQSSDITRMAGLDSTNVRRKIAALKEAMPDFMQRHSKDVVHGQITRVMLDRLATVVVLCRVGANQDGIMLASLLEFLETHGYDEELKYIISNFYCANPKVRPDAC